MNERSTVILQTAFKRTFEVVCLRKAIGVIDQQKRQSVEILVEFWLNLTRLWKITVLSLTN